MLLVSFTATVCSRAQNPGILTPFAEGFTSPVTITHAGDSRLFVVNQPGSIFIVDSTGTVNAEPFLDITDKVIFGGEQGLLGLAFHPDYKDNGYFYVNYIGAGDSTHIARFSMQPGNPDKADPQSGLNLLTIEQPYKNHNGGSLVFGPDGYLYIALGDGGSGGDPENRAQNLTEYLGKILRIDVDNVDPYSIPESNPYFNLNSARSEIWALGLRNPWKFSFDRLTGDLWIADVGQNQVEEINFQPANSTGGENYGWRCYEGNDSFEPEGCSAEEGYTFPVHTYPHGAECSVTGGYVYRGDSLSPYYGRYFFADYCSDRIWTLRKETSNWVREDFGRFAGNNFSAFGEDIHGELYVAGHSNGIIYRISSFATGLPPEKKLSGIQLFYNPVSRKFLLEINPDIAREAILSIYDIRGAVRFRKMIHDEKYEFDTGRLPYGVYLLSLWMDGKYWSHKLIIEQ